MDPVLLGIIEGTAAALFVVFVGAGVLAWWLNRRG